MTERKYLKDEFKPIQVTWTLEQLVEAGEWWADVLGLGGWTIDIELARGFTIPESEAEVTWTLTKRRATVRLLDPNDKPNGDPIDMERALVHELLHVVFAAWDDSSRDGMSEILIAVGIEQPIERLAILLVAFRRNIAKYKFKREDQF